MIFAESATARQSKIDFPIAFSRLVAVGSQSSLQAFQPIRSTAWVKFPTGFEPMTFDLGISCGNRLVTGLCPLLMLWTAPPPGT